MECNKVYFDTNIVLDLLNPKRPYHVASSEVLTLCIANEIEIIISEDMLSTIFYINKNNTKTLTFFKTIQKRWIISPFGKDVITQAIETSLEKNIDFEDALQCLCAKENGCDFLISNDSTFYECGVEILGSKEFLDLFGENHE